MHVVDVTTAANFFGRITGITRSEMMIARALRDLGEAVEFVYWSNDKSCFETHSGDLDFEAIRLSRLSFDLTENFALAQTETLARLEHARHLIVTGSGWLQNTHYTRGCLEHARAAGLKTLFYVHDLIPVRFPYFYDEAYVVAFERNLTLIVRHANVLACNSENTLRDLREWCETRGLPEPRATVAHLGDSIAGPQGSASGLLPEGLEGRDIVLSVGAIHRRKNYELLALVWRRLAARMGERCPVLVIVGGVTSDGATLAREIAKDPILSRRIVILSGIDDDALDALYRAAKLVAYPSLYEGWGLPVAEALSYGRVCLASDVSAIPEIADLGPDLLPHDDVPVWTGRILHYLQNPEARAAREAELPGLYRTRGWDETARAIVRAVEDAPQTPVPMLYPGDRIDLAQADAAPDILVTPGYNPQDGARWMIGPSAQLRFRLPERALGRAYVLRIEGLRRMTALPTRVMLGGTTLAEVAADENLTLEVDVKPTLEVDVPAGALQQVNDLVIEGGHAVAVPSQKDKPWVLRFSDMGLGAISLLTDAQVAYERDVAPRLVDPIPESASNRPVFVPTPDDPNEMPGLRVRQASDKGLATGSLRLQTTRTLSPGPQPEPIWLELSGLDAKSDLVFAIRQDGRPVSHSAASGARPILRNGGDCLLALRLEPHSAPRRLSMEVTAFAGSPLRPVPFKLRRAWLPTALVADGTHPVLPEIPARTYLRFGTDGDDVSQSIAASGWQNEAFGISCDLHGVLSARFVEPGDNLARLKLRMKRSHRTMKGARVIVDGHSHEIALEDDLENYIVTLVKPVRDGDAMTVQIVPIVTEDTLDAAPWWKRERIILRGAQLVT